MAEVGRTFADEIVQTWYRGELNPYVLELTPEEAEGLKSFFYVCEMVTRCYGVSAQLSPVAWKEIQHLMLQPFDGKNEDQFTNSK